MWTNDDLKRTITFNGLLTTVVVEDRFTGIKGVGHALCDPFDTYDETYGETLAAVRAYRRFLGKLEKIYSGGAVIDQEYSGQSFQKTNQFTQPSRTIR